MACGLCGTKKSLDFNYQSLRSNWSAPKILSWYVVYLCLMFYPYKNKAAEYILH